MTIANDFAAVIFDFDGVLFDSEPTHLKAGNHVLSPFNIYIDQETYFKNYVGMPDLDFFHLILSTHGHTVSSEKVLQLTEKKYSEFKRLINEHDNLNAKDSLVPVLETLANIKKRIAICSSSTRGEIETTISKFKNGVIKPFFEIITTIDDVSMGKPSPEGYQLTSTRLNIAPDQCLVIEDTPVGIRAAKSAGMTVVGLVGTHSADKLTQADRIIHQLPDIFNL